jgi:hypothetical protein
MAFGLLYPSLKIKEPHGSTEGSGEITNYDGLPSVITVSNRHFKSLILAYHIGFSLYLHKNKAIF